MRVRFSHLCHILFPVLLLCQASVPAIAQQGQYHLPYSPFVLQDSKPIGGLATYYPIKSIDGETIRLRGDDGTIYTFKLDAGTIYCQGDQKVADWTFLKSIGKKQTVTVMTNDDDSQKALVIWDRPPSVSNTNGGFKFALPPMCK